MRAMTRGFLRACVAAVVAMSCDGSTTPATGDGGAAVTTLMRPRSEPIEYVGITIERPVTDADFVAFFDPLLGDALRAGRGHRDLELQPGLLLTAAVDARTADQAVVAVDMVPPTPAGAARRPVLRAPFSFAYGRVYVDAVRAAFAETNRRLAAREDTQPWHLELNSTSANGGHVTIAVAYDGAGASTLTFTNENPRTSLRPGQVNHAAFRGDPYESISGTVSFTLSRDEFAFFTNRAYGITSGAAQNFRDFQLEPHNWLRLTVSPRLQDQVVDVGFEVITLDGRRVPLARAPASYLAGDQFQQNVFRLVDNMNAQEARQRGSSTPWTGSFYYDDPAGGGVVSVVAHGRRGVFSIDYAVESPTHPLRDVEFVPIQSDLVLPRELPRVANSCAEMDSSTALRGRARLRFSASSTVRTSPAQHGPLRGPVWFDVYRAEDVTIVGPNAGARPVTSFHVERVDLTDASQQPEFELPDELSAGTYQILGFMDTNGNADPMNPNPDAGDPVTLPIGAYNVQCAQQTLQVEFALLLPPDR